ncbi:MAG: DEAD/DEAH box helicase family protein [Betaproteobacteria bacterium]|nr:DEAD/DEAH box helicase family protein [Betaproteobacteria bacterium]
MGKTFVGLMLIERLVKFERKKVLLIVPKSGREPVWESSLRRYLPGVVWGLFNLVLINHTDLQRGGEWVEKSSDSRNRPDVIVIDEAHHFRNPSTKKDTSRYWQMQALAKDKQVFMLTATPINNRLIDLQHLIEHFTQREAGHFKDTLGIHSLPGHFRKLERAEQAHGQRAIARRTGGLGDGRHPFARQFVSRTGGAAQPCLRAAKPDHCRGQGGAVPKA